MKVNWISWTNGSIPAWRIPTGRLPSMGAADVTGLAYFVAISIHHPASHHAGAVHNPEKCKPLIPNSYVVNHHGELGSKGEETGGRRSDLHRDDF
jgi:hypothetical protein